MTETPPEVTTWSGDADVRLVLGKLGDRLPAAVDLEQHRQMARAQLLDALADVYPGDLPTFAGDALQVLRWAEARLAGANILDILRAATGTDVPVAAELRASALGTVEGGVAGYKPGGATPTDPGGGGGPVGPTLPLVSNVRRVSAFADPYAVLVPHRRYDVEPPELDVTVVAAEFVVDPDDPYVATIIP